MRTVVAPEGRRLLLVKVIAFSHVRQVHPASLVVNMQVLQLPHTFLSESQSVEHEEYAPLVLLPDLSVWSHFAV